MSMLSFDVNYRPACLRTMAKGDLFYIAREKSGFSQHALCEFVGIEKGRVVATSVKHYFSKGHTPNPELAEGKAVKVMASKCFLYGRPEGDAVNWNRYVWFKTLDNEI